MWPWLLSAIKLEALIPEEALIPMVVSPARTPSGAVAGNGQNGNNAPPFDRSTRLSMVPIASMARPVGGGSSPEVQLPSNGLLGGLLLEIRGTIGGTVGAVSALGMASIVKRVTLRLNSGTVVWSLTGPDYHYLYKDWIDAGFVDVAGQDNSRDPVTATGAILDMVIPLQVNLRDPIGMLLLQNRQTILTLIVEWEADTVVTATGTFTGFTCVPMLLTYSVPPNPGSLPPLRYIHQVVDESKVLSGAGDDVYDVPRANTYLNIIQGTGIGATGADSWSRSFLRVNQSSYIMDFVPNKQDMLFRYLHGRARELGMIAYPFLATSGLGAYGTTRDLYDSSRVTDLQIVTTVTGALTRYTVREQMVDLFKA